jgi:hypothetical protein
MCLYCDKHCGQREFCDETCYHEYMEARQEQNDGYRDEYPVGPSQFDSFGEPPEFDVIGGL